VKLHQSVVVFGAGTVGLMCAAVAKAMGASNIVSVDTNSTRLEFAKEFASNASYLPSRSDTVEEMTEAIVSQNGLGRGADAVLEATGAEACIEAGIHVLRHGGTFVQVGLGKEKVQFPIVLAAEKEVCLRGSFRYAAGDFELAVELLQTGKVKTKDLITNIVDFEHATEAWELTRKGVGIKNMIRGPKA
jgi:D-xylulose reductase